MLIEAEIENLGYAIVATGDNTSVHCTDEKIKSRRRLNRMAAIVCELRLQLKHRRNTALPEKSAYNGLLETHFLFFTRAWSAYVRIPAPLFQSNTARFCSRGLCRATTKYRHHAACKPD